MARLTASMKTYIVQRLACFDRPSGVVDGLRLNFGIEVSRQTVENHDPTKAAGANLAKKWVAIFQEARQQFLNDIEDIGVAHKAVRLRLLDRMFRKAEEMGNLVFAASLLEQAAKESGEAYTNQKKVEMTGKNGGPVDTRWILEAVSPQEAADKYTEMVKK